jgi:hypothetical protein
MFSDFYQRVKATTFFLNNYNLLLVLQVDIVQVIRKPKLIMHLQNILG